MENGFGSKLNGKRSRAQERLFVSCGGSKACVETSLDAAHTSARATSYFRNFVFGFGIIFGLLAGDGMVFGAEAKNVEYTGAGSCSSPACHGRVKPYEDKTPALLRRPLLLNEYSTWVVRDKHAQAYTALTNKGKQIAKILGIEPTDEKCLACHSVLPKDPVRPTFDINDGVGCENCHGPASEWLGLHTTSSWRYEESIKQEFGGMYDTRDLIKRSEKCLSCHLGTAEKFKFVNHEMIAAGHPDLYFEMNSFTSVMPAHWNEADEVKKDPLFEVRALAVGQAVQLREQLKRVAREAHGGAWPEYAELECVSCHHSLVEAKDSWRQKRYSERRPMKGDPQPEKGKSDPRLGHAPLNYARFVVFRWIIQEVDPANAQQLELQMHQVYSLVTALGSDRTKVTTQATDASKTADRIAQNLNGKNGKPFDPGAPQRLMKSISGDGDSIAYQGERSAEQATMVLASLFVAYKNNGAVAKEAEIKAAIDTLFEQVKYQSAYKADKFAGEMKILNSLLP